MHTVALIIAGFMTLLLAGPALLRGGLVRAWLSTAASIVPTGVLYLAYADENAMVYLAPMFILFTIALLKAAMVLTGMLRNTPRSMNNVPAEGAPHWAA